LAEEPSASSETSAIAANKRSNPSPEARPTRLSTEGQAGREPNAERISLGRRAAGRSFA
jgi:hypothetical protein